MNVYTLELYYNGRNLGCISVFTSIENAKRFAEAIDPKANLGEQDTELVIEWGQGRPRRAAIPHSEQPVHTASMALYGTWELYGFAITQFELFGELSPNDKAQAN